MEIALGDGRKNLRLNNHPAKGILAHRRKKDMGNISERISLVFWKYDVSPLRQPRQEINWYYLYCEVVATESCKSKSIHFYLAGIINILVHNTSISLLQAMQEMQWNLFKPGWYETDSDSIPTGTFIFGWNRLCNLGLFLAHGSCKSSNLNPRPSLI